MNTPSRRKAATTYKAKLAEAGFRQKAFRFPADVAARLEARAKAAGQSELKFLAALIMGEDAPPPPKASPRKAAKPAAKSKAPKAAPKAPAAPKRSIVSALNIPVGGKLR